MSTSGSHKFSISGRHSKRKTRGNSSTEVSPNKPYKFHKNETDNNSKMGDNSDSETELYDDPNCMQAVFDRMLRKSEKRVQKFITCQIDNLKKELIVPISLAEQVPKLKEKVTELEKKVSRLENRDKFKNLVIHGIDYKHTETSADRHKIIQNIALKLKLPHIDYAEAYRLGPKTSAKRPLLVKLLRSCDKIQIMINAKHLSGTNISIGDDLNLDQRKVRGILFKKKQELLAVNSSTKFSVRNGILCATTGTNKAFFKPNIQTSVAEQIPTPVTSPQRLGNPTTELNSPES